MARFYLLPEQEQMAQAVTMGVPGCVGGRPGCCVIQRQNWGGLLECRLALLRAGLAQSDGCCAIAGHRASALKVSLSHVSLCFYSQRLETTLKE